MLTRQGWVQKRSFLLLIVMAVCLLVGLVVLSSDEEGETKKGCQSVLLCPNV